MPDTKPTIFSSPLGGAETSAIIAHALDITQPIVFDDRLKEVSMGSWDGLTTTEIDEGWPNARSGLGANEWFFHSPDGESYDDMAVRVCAALDVINSALAFPKIIVCQGVTSRIIRGIIGGLGKTAASNLEVPQDAVFRIDGSGEVERLE